MYKRLKECATTGSIANLDLSLHIWPAAISYNLRSINRIFSLGFSKFGCSILNSLRFDWRSRKWGSLFGSLHSRGKKEKIDFFGILQWCLRGFEAGRLENRIWKTLSFDSPVCLCIHGVQFGSTKAMSGPQCCKNPPSLNPNSGAGDVEQLGGLSRYIAGFPHSKLTILVVSDILGILSPTPTFTPVKTQQKSSSQFLNLQDIENTPTSIPINSSTLLSQKNKDPPRQASRIQSAPLNESAYSNKANQTSRS